LIRAVASAALLASCGGYRAHDPASDGGPAGDAGDAPDCDSQPESPGCPCDVAEPIVCYEGPEGTMGVGPCLAGIRACSGGRWSLCAGQVLPQAEMCNGWDEDCNGVVDDAWANACGNCDPECASFLFGPQDGATPFDPDDGMCVELDPKGGLVMVRSSTGIYVTWIPNTPDGTISRIETRTREEEGRYPTGAGADEQPSRTSIDYFGDVYVANRNPVGIPSVTRILATDCQDADADGVVETSEGRDDVRAWGEDECVLWNEPVGDVGARANAVSYVPSVGLDGVLIERVWVGLEGQSRYLELDAWTGAATGVEADVSPCTSIGSVTDWDGNLWSACGDSRVARFATETPEDSEIMEQPLGTNVGIDADPYESIWVGGSVSRFDTETDEWTTLPGVLGHGVVSDGDGSVWVGDCAVDGGARGTCRIDVDLLDVDWYDMDSRAVAVDFDGYIWGVPASGTIDVIDPDDPDTVETIFDDCDGPGGACLTAPDAYGDLIGFQLRNALDPQCTWETILEGCGDGWTTRWLRLEWESDVPAGSWLAIQLRSADTIEALAASSWLDVGEGASPIDLESLLGDGSDGGFLQVRVLFMSVDREALPTLRSIGIHRSCW